MRAEGLYHRYRALLLEGFVPFWFKHGIDWEYGGVLSCIHEDGTLAGEDKFTWSQARSVWTFSALYNRIEPRSEFLRAAENSVRFLMAHGRDSPGPLGLQHQPQRQRARRSYQHLRRLLRRVWIQRVLSRDAG